MRDQYIKSGEGFLLFYSITSQISFNATTKLRKTILKIKEVPQEEEFQVFLSYVVNININAVSDNFSWK